MTQPTSEPTHDTDSTPGDGGERAARLVVVGIGASAGGLEALEALIGRLAPSPEGMAFVVLQHLAPGRSSALSEILGRCTSMKMVLIEDGQRLAPNTIFIAPPSVEVALEAGVLRLTRQHEGLRHSIDGLLRSLAADRGPQAIGVILSGAGSDGTLGLKAIKEEGGITFVQEPGTASQSSMPQSALDAGCADFCLAPAEIGDELVRLASHPILAVERPARLFDQQALSHVFDLLHRAFGVDFSSYKLTTIERRLERRLALQKLERAADYEKLLEANPGELSILFSDLLIGVTGFFRDREPFEALKSVVFPRLFAERGPEAPLRIWVPGCSTGEEAYSIAMCVVEFFDGRPGSHAVQIFATDIDDQALARARQGIYPQAIELDLSPDRLQRFFSRHEKAYQVTRPIRDMVVFAPHNLGKDPPFSRLDLVSCRNVLIYMQAGLQRRALRTFHYALNPDGFLLLGTSESVGDAADLFTLVDRNLKIYAKKNVASAGVFDFVAARQGLGAPARGVGQGSMIPGERRPVALSLQQLADRKVLDKYGPPGVLVDENLDVLQFRGRTGPYLDPTPGAPTFQILKLVRPELIVPLRTALQRVFKENMPFLTEPVVLWGERGSAGVRLDVMPLVSEAGRRCVVVLFQEEVPPAGAAAARLQPAQDLATEPRVEVLEHELLMTKEYLQTTVQELESANEELQSSNEELQSSNEELQSSNEELETSKEELQSTNEELATVNDELQSRMTQLGVSNDDLQNVLADTISPLIIVGMDLRIRRFSAAAEKLLNLIVSDVGRPVGCLNPALNVPDVDVLVSEAINTVREVEQRVRLPQGQWHTLRAIPYRTADLAIRGAVLELTRTPPPRKPSGPPEIHELVGKVLSTLPNTLVLLDDQLRMVWSNKAFFDAFQVGTEVLGRPLEEVWGGRDLHPDLWKRIEDTVASGSPLHEIETECPVLGRMRLSAHRLPPEADRAALTLVTMAAVGGS